MPYPVEDIARTERPEGLLYANNVPDRGDYRPLRPNVSRSHLGLLLTNDCTTGRCGPRHIPWYRTPGYPGPRAAQYPSKHQLVSRFHVDV